MSAMLLILLSLIAPLQSKYAEGMEHSTPTVIISCDTGLISVTDARYYAPSNPFCTSMGNAASVTKSKCNEKVSCTIQTAPNKFYGEPCWGSQKKVKVWYDCKSCAGGQFLTGSKCVNCPEGRYTSAVSATWTRHPDTYLLGYSSGEHNYGTLQEAQTVCLKKNDCNGITYEAGSGKYTTRAGTSLSRSTNNEETWKALKTGQTSCTQCPDGKSVRLGEGSTEADCGIVPWKKYTNKFLLGYSSGEQNYNSLQDAQTACLKKADCNGITFQTESGKYTTRKSTDLTGSTNNEISWMPLKHNGVICVCSHINSDSWTATSIDYDIDNGVVVPTKPSAVAIKTINNAGSQPQSLTLSVSEEVTETMSFTHTAGVSVTVGATFSVGVPLVAEAEISTEVSTSYEFSYGTEKSVTKTMSSDFVCTGSPGMKTVCNALLIKDTVTIPYTMIWTKNDEQTCKCEEKGKFSEVAANKLEMSIEETDLKSKEVRRSKREVMLTKISGGFENYKH